jgi:hypothetical protein
VRIDHGLDSILPCAIKINALNFRENIYNGRDSSHSEELVTHYEVFGCQAIEGCAELAQRVIDRPRVFGVWFDEEVDIFGGAWLRVKRDSLATNDQILNFLGVEDGQEFFEVVEHRAPVPSFGRPQG